MKCYPDTSGGRDGHRYDYVIYDPNWPHLKRKQHYGSPKHTRLLQNTCYWCIRFFFLFPFIFFNKSYSHFYGKGPTLALITYIIPYWVIPAPRGIWVAWSTFTKSSKLTTLPKTRYSLKKLLKTRLGKFFWLALQEGMKLVFVFRCKVKIIGDKLFEIQLIMFTNGK